MRSLPVLDVGVTSGMRMLEADVGDGPNVAVGSGGRVGGAVGVGGGGEPPQAVNSSPMMLENTIRRIRPPQCLKPPLTLYRSRQASQVKDARDNKDIKNADELRVQRQE
jgi:hypothetical protein